MAAPSSGLNLSLLATLSKDRPQAASWLKEINSIRRSFTEILDNRLKKT